MITRSACPPRSGSSLFVVVAAITAASGLDVAVRMRETIAPAPSRSFH